MPVQSTPPVVSSSLSGPDVLSAAPDMSQSNHPSQQTSSDSFSPTTNPAISIRGGLSKNTANLARQLLHPIAEQDSGHQDQTLLFSSGLQWLLNSATEVERAAARQSRRPSLLNEDAVRRIDKGGGGGRISLDEDFGGEGNGKLVVHGARKIHSWLDQQTDAQK